MEIDEIIIHPDYTKTPPNNDVALLKLKTPLNLDKYTPVCLPEMNQEFDQRTAWVYGWGRWMDGRVNNTGPVILRHTTARVLSEQQCVEDYRRAGHTISHITQHLCAFGSSFHDHDICIGDSGGPLTVEQSDGRHTLIGVVSGSDKRLCGGVKILSTFILDPSLIIA